MGRPATDRRRFNGSVSRWRRHSVSPAERRRQSHCSPNRGVDSKNLRYGRWSRRQRLPHCRRTISPRSERPSKAWRDRSQARACWSSVVNLDHGRTWGHPGTACRSATTRTSVSAIANWSFPVYAAILGASMIGAQTRVFLSDGRSWRHHRNSCARSPEESD